MSANLIAPIPTTAAWIDANGNPLPEFQRLILTMLSAISAIPGGGVLPVGPPGATGAPGPPGQLGFDGEPGEDGPLGPPGQPGTPGSPGSLGPQGVPGMPGWDGEDGRDGYPVPGPQGSPGSPGATGPQGVPGFAGLDGEDGADGFVPGPTGARGLTGLTGAMGAPGIDGDDGVEPMMIPGSQGPAGSSTGQLLNIQRISATGAGTYTPTAGTNSVIIYLQGAGGGSSGIASPGAAKVSMSRAGGAGATIRVRLTTAFSGASYTVGALGTGGTSGDNAGVNGADTVFTATGGGGTVYTAGGGPGGNNGGSALASFPTFSNGVAGGTATNGDVKVNGIGSLFGLALTSTLVLGGSGGFSPYGASGAGTNIFSANTLATGGPGQGFGSGGGAPIATGTAGPSAGANGANGYIEIWEYS